MTFIREKTNIPIPVLHCSFEDDDAVYLIMQYVEGLSMAELGDNQRTTVQQELEQHFQMMHSLCSSRMGGLSGIVLLPYRATIHSFLDKWRPKEFNESEKICLLPQRPLAAKRSG